MLQSPEWPTLAGPRQGPVFLQRTCRIVTCGHAWLCVRLSCVVVLYDCHACDCVMHVIGMHNWHACHAWLSHVTLWFGMSKFSNGTLTRESIKDIKERKRAKLLIFDTEHVIMNKWNRTLLCTSLFLCVFLLLIQVWVSLWEWMHSHTFVYKSATVCVNLLLIQVLRVSPWEWTYTINSYTRAYNVWFSVCQRGVEFGV